MQTHITEHKTNCKCCTKAIAANTKCVKYNGNVYCSGSCAIDHNSNREANAQYRLVFGKSFERTI